MEYIDEDGMECEFCGRHMFREEYETYGGCRACFNDEKEVYCDVCGAELQDNEHLFNKELERCNDCRASHQDCEECYAIFENHEMNSDCRGYGYCDNCYKKIGCEMSFLCKSCLMCKRCCDLECGKIKRDGIKEKLLMKTVLPEDVIKLIIKYQ